MSHAKVKHHLKNAAKHAEKSRMHHEKAAEAAKGLKHEKHEAKERKLAKELLEMNKPKRGKK